MTKTKVKFTNYIFKNNQITRDDKMKEKLFPYNYRDQQKEMEAKINDEIWNSNICIHAATGFGKTPVILSSLLPYTNNYTILWAVRTGNETDRPIEELKTINRKNGEDFFGFSYRGKRDMCLLAKEKDLGESPSYSDISFLCQNEGEGCPYKDKLSRVNPDSIADGPLLYSEIMNSAKNLEVCPYYLQQKLLPEADVISLNYNYIIDENLSWVIQKEIPFKKCFLVVDEAHNLQKAASGLNSDQITLRTLTRSLNELERFETEKSEKLYELVKLIHNEIKKRGKDLKDEARLNMEEFLNRFLKNWGEDTFELKLNLEEITAYGRQLREEQLERGQKPRSSLFHLGKFWKTILEKYDIEGVETLIKKQSGTIAIEYWDMRSSEILKDRWKKFKGCAFCSGTLKPIKAFATTAGLEKIKSISIGSFYESKNIISFIPSDLTTKGKKLHDNMADKYVEAITKFAKKIDSNVAIFSASYRIQNRLIEQGLKKEIGRQGRRFYQEERGMDGNKAREILEDFKREARRSGRGFLCATATGRFAEGADFPGEELEGLFLVGIPFDRMGLRTELYLDYYKKKYGQRKGTYYGYIVPALRRASQALGRVLRSENDKGVFVCGDKRYADKRFHNLLPEYIKNNVRKTSNGKLVKDLELWGREVMKS